MQTLNTHTLETFRIDKHEHREIVSLTQEQLIFKQACRGTCKQSCMRLQISSLIVPSLFPVAYVTTTTDDPKMGNNLYLLTRPDDKETHSGPQTVVVSSGQSPMKIT